MPHDHLAVPLLPNFICDPRRVGVAVMLGLVMGRTRPVLAEAP